MARIWRPDTGKGSDRVKVGNGFFVARQIVFGVVSYPSAVAARHEDRANGPS
ncbi:MAG: hypothetical protein ACRDJC_18875 [Thermomicrobiales bacterium]